MATPGYGIGGYGTSSYGGFGTGVSLANAFAVGTRTVRVFLDGAARRSSPFTDGDALNPNTWEVRRLDTDAALPVVAVSMFNDPDVFDITTLVPFQPFHTLHNVSTSTLRSAFGVLVSDPRDFDFAGCLAEVLATPEKVATTKKAAFRDLSNPPSPNAEQLSGTLQINGSGDYSLVEGAALVKKLILRRLTATKGDFFHLPDYGLDLNVKGKYTSSDLIKLKAEVERQCLRENEVESASARVSLGTNGLMTVDIKVRLAPTGQTLPISLSVAPGALLSL